MTVVFSLSSNIQMKNRKLAEGEICFDYGPRSWTGWSYSQRSIKRTHHLFVTEQNIPQLMGI